MVKILLLSGGVFLLQAYECAGSPRLKPMDWATLSRLQQLALLEQKVTLNEFKPQLRRTRHSAWLPDLRFRYAHGLDDVYRASIDNAQADTLSNIDSSARAGSEHRFEVELRWQLARLVFHPAEAEHRARQLRLQTKAVRLKIQVMDAYVKWSQALLSKGRAKTIESHKLARGLIGQWALVLNTLTGGRLSKALEMAGTK